MTVSVERYPHGYVTALPSDQRFVGKSYGNSVVAQLYKELLGNKQIVTNWRFTSQVTEIALRLFGRDLNQWVNLQVPNNPYIYGINRDFIEDTLNYIVTGVRKTPLTIWMELLVEDPREKSKIERYNDISKEIRVRVNSGPLYISQWLSHPDGVSDLVATLNIIFGYTKKSSEEETNEIERSKK